MSHLPLINLACFLNSLGPSPPPAPSDPLSGLTRHILFSPIAAHPIFSSIRAPRRPGAGETRFSYNLVALFLTKLCIPCLPRPGKQGQEGARTSMWSGWQVRGSSWVKGTNP